MSVVVDVVCGGDVPGGFEHSEDIGEHFEALISSASVVRLKIARLVLNDSPRSCGEDIGHVRALADSDQELPPIVVHAPTMRVVDGAHRVRAALLRNAEEIDARLFEGSEKDAFVLAVRMNTRHGLPLTYGDRVAAAARIVESHPNWSDRMIASITGLAAKTVGTLRRRSTADGTQSNARMGYDGRVRPLSSAEGRIKAGRIVELRPDATLREIAREAGISVSTAQDVRKRMLSGLGPVPLGRRAARIRSTGDAAAGLVRPLVAPTPSVEQCLVSLSGVEATVAQLSKDPSLRFNEKGRALVRLLLGEQTALAASGRLFEAVPDHCAGAVASLAAAYARVWADLAQLLKNSAV